ncbi:MAG TPA: hypothetical protein VJ727_05820 [Rhodanobacteraceae bacterium]|nr:hypothetical protein [Rhodanobacteraceae bacterium]
MAANYPRAAILGLLPGPHIHVRAFGSTADAIHGIGYARCLTPALLDARAPARTRTSLCSNSRAFPARPAAMLGVMRRGGSSLNTAIHGLQLGKF